MKREPFFTPNNPLNPKNWGWLQWLIFVMAVSWLLRVLVRSDCQVNGLDSTICSTGLSIYRTIFGG